MTEPRVKAIYDIILTLEDTVETLEEIQALVIAANVARDISHDVPTNEFSDAGLYGVKWAFIAEQFFRRMMAIYKDAPARELKNAGLELRQMIQPQADAEAV